MKRENNHSSSDISVDPNDDHVGEQFANHYEHVEVPIDPERSSSENVDLMLVEMMVDCFKQADELLEQDNIDKAGQLVAQGVEYYNRQRDIDEELTPPDCVDADEGNPQNHVDNVLARVAHEMQGWRVEEENVQRHIDAMRAEIVSRIRGGDAR